MLFTIATILDVNILQRHSIKILDSNVKILNEHIPKARIQKERKLISGGFTADRLRINLL